MKKKNFLTFLGIALLSIPFLLPQTASAQELDFEYYKDHIYLSTTVNGKPARLILDTGASDIMLDSTFLADSGLTFAKKGKARISGAGNGTEDCSIIVDGVTVALGGRKFKPQFTAILDFREIIESDKVDGLIGMKYLSDKVIKIDYKNRKITFLDKLQPGMTDGYTAVAVAWNPKQPGMTTLPMEVSLPSGKTIAGKALLDTGAGVAISFNAAGAARFKLDELADKKPYEKKHGGVGGADNGFKYGISSIKVGGLSAPVTEGYYSTNKDGAMAKAGYDAIMGNKYWKNFDLILDVRNNKLYLKLTSD